MFPINKFAPKPNLIALEDIVRRNHAHDDGHLVSVFPSTMYVLPSAKHFPHKRDDMSYRARKSSFTLGPYLYSFVAIAAVGTK